MEVDWWMVEVGCWTVSVGQRKLIDEWWRLTSWLGGKWSGCMVDGESWLFNRIVN